MRHSFQLAILLLLATATTRAQVYSPDNLIGKPPAPPTRQRITPSAENLQYLWQFTRPAPLGTADALRLDSRFQTFLSTSFKQPQSVWGSPSSHPALATVIPLFLTRYGAVIAEHNRYITIDGCVPSFCAAAGLLWVDLGRPHPLAVFAAVNWNPDSSPIADPAAEYTLSLFPDRQLSPDELPLALTEAIAHWSIRLSAAHRLVPHVTHALIVEPDGSPFALDPAMAGANTIAPQPDTTTPPDEN